MNFTSQVTFLYFNELEEAKHFFNQVLGLEVVYDPGWACIWRVGKDSFIGGVDVKRGSIEVESRGGVLISLTVDNIEVALENLKKHKIKDLPEIKYFEEIQLKSLIFTGPEGYKFEIQEFITEEQRKLF